MLGKRTFRNPIAQLDSNLKLAKYDKIRRLRIQKVDFGFYSRKWSVRLSILKEQLISTQQSCITLKDVKKSGYARIALGMRLSNS